MIKVSDYIAQRLCRHYGIKDMFMVSGGGAMHLNDSFGKCMNYICCHNEQACSIAAEGYARSLGNKLALVNVTTGPGGLNALNGVFGSWTDSAPVLFISGQVKFSTTLASCPDIPLRQLGDQEVDIISVVKPLTKYAAMITDVNTVKYHLDCAVWEATHNRFGPVWLDVPMNIQGALMDENTQKEFTPPLPRTYDLKIDEVIKKLTAAKRPLIVAGHGIRLGGQIEAFHELLNKLDFPVVTTFNGYDVIENGHKNYIGRIGTIGQRAGNFALQNADCILFLGTRNNIRQASYNWENFADKAFKIIVDIDEAELNKPTVKADLPVHADLSVFLPALLEKTPKITKTEWLNWCQERRQKYAPETTPDHLSDEQSINPYHFVYTLTALMSENDILVAANGSACVCTFQTGVVKQGQRQFWNSGDASMGYEPAAVGACIATGGKNTICIAGDGSIMMNLQELQTIRHHNLPIKIFIINNDGYLSIKQTQNNFFEGRHCGDGRCSGVTLPDFQKIGNAFDIKSVRIKKTGEMEKAIKEVLAAKEPMICEVIVNPDCTFSPKLSARKLDDGTMISPSLEDMYPFLPRYEFEKNIIND